MSGDVFTVPISSTKVFPQEFEQNPNPKSAKKRRNLPGTPDPDAEVIALSPGTLMAKNRFLCEICNKGFQRDQNLQLHRRGHNLPWKLKQRAKTDQIKKKVYICPEKTCVHHDAARALGDLTGVKKHYSRKHGEKKWKCEKCSKKYAVQSDWKAHSKTCGTREYKCDCGTLFSRRDSFITHRAFCDALAEESAKNITAHHVGSNNLSFRSEHNNLNGSLMILGDNNHNNQQRSRLLPLWLDHQTNSTGLLVPPNEIMQMGSNNLMSVPDSQSLKEEALLSGKGNSVFADSVPSLYSSDYISCKSPSSVPMSATALLQKAAQMGSTKSNAAFIGAMMNTSSSSSSTNFGNPFTQNRSELHQVFGNQTPTSGLMDHNSLTRDFLGMGRGGGDPFFSPELAKFVSMSSAMGLGNFPSNH